jgi:hypothetical protein
MLAATPLGATVWEPTIELAAAKGRVYGGTVADMATSADEQTNKGDSTVYQGCGLSPTTSPTTPDPGGILTVMSVQ